jgi:hypothetical protein
VAPWLAKAALATLAVTPVFVAIPYLKRNHAIDPLVFLAWYFGATAVSVAAFLAIAGRGAELAPRPLVIAAIVAIGLTLGATANGLLFQAVTLAPNPGLPPVVYATSSMIVFVLSVLLAALFPQLFVTVSSDPVRLSGIALVIAGLFLLAGGANGGAGR